MSTITSKRRKLICTGNVLVIIIIFTLLNAIDCKRPGKLLHYVAEVPEASPERLLSLVADPVTNVEFSDVYLRRCNISMYAATTYKAAWDLAETYRYTESSQLFDNFIHMERKGRSPEWRQAVCDGWPFSLFECAMFPGKGFHVCQCLKTQTTEYVEEMLAIDTTTDGVKDLEIKVCRVKEGRSCSDTSLPLACAATRECISGKCAASGLSPWSCALLANILSYFFMFKS